MAKVRARADNGNLFLDFYYREKRCREQTALADTTENRKKVQALLNRIEKEIARGVFDYAATFPGSPRAKAFALDDMRSRTPVSAAIKASLPTSATPLLADFSDVWFNEMTPQWRRSHRSCVRDVLDKHILPMFGSRPVASIQKADVLSFRAHLAKLPGRKAETLTPGRVNKVMCFLRQILNEAADRFEFTPAFRKVKPLKMKKSDVQPFSMDEVQRILDTIRVDYRNYMTTRFFTGMRTGEINGLKWKYVDFERNLILVRETLVEGEAEEGTKTESSQRDIPMLPMVRAAIDAQFKARDPGMPVGVRYAQWWSDRRAQLHESRLVSVAALSGAGEAPPVSDPTHRGDADAGSGRESGMDRDGARPRQHVDAVPRVLAFRTEPDASGRAGIRRPGESRQRSSSTAGVRRRRAALKAQVSRAGRAEEAARDDRNELDTQERNHVSRFLSFVDLSISGGDQAPGVN
jgi:integrase